MTDKKKILLVDDDPAVRRMLFRLLAEENYFVLTATSSTEALGLAGACAVDLVLLDMNLLSREGWAILQRFTMKEPELPIIVMSAKPNQRFPALTPGRGALMEKPLDLPKLLLTIKDLLDQAASRPLPALAVGTDYSSGSSHESQPD